MSITRRAALALTPLLLLAACGDDSSTPAGSVVEETTIANPEGTFPVTVQASNGAVTIASRPTAIVSLAPTSTEMLFAIGAGNQVIAVDDQSNYPENAPRTDLSSYTPNVEAIAEQEPDLVVVTDDRDGLVATLGKLSIPVVVVPAATKIEDTYDEIELLGAATGNVAGAAEVVANMQSDISAILASVPQRETTLRVYHELDPTYFSAASKSFIGTAYTMLGLDNIADAADTADTAGYPQLSAEAIVAADPDLIVLADTKCCQQDAAAVAARPGWSEVAAVRNGAVVSVDDDIASRWGPRFVEFLRTVAKAVARVPAAA